MVFRTFREYCQLQEMAARKQLSRIVDMAQDPKRLMVIISASRDGDEVWKGATKALENDIRSRGYKVSVKKGGVTREISKKLPGEGPVGITPTHGGYDEEGTDVREKSLFVSMPKNAVAPSNEDIIDFFVTLAEKYQQMGVLIKLPGEDETFEYTTRHHGMGAGHRIPYNEPRADPQPPYYTRPRYRGTSTTFDRPRGERVKTSRASDKDALVFDPEFDKPQVMPFDRPYNKGG